jgi:hypothetical protein
VGVAVSVAVMVGVSVTGSWKGSELR